ncbi:putative F-box protein At3g16210 [Prosopis cineraria]|uniref:putative F-box protein At3g16210 n=1 Tax=Prosopis cineraria TaxID=364024 RepID=UPI00240F301B|nr:putative F-box protein At3g16210 [Prosopis cineraria]
MKARTERMDNLNPNGLLGRLSSMMIVGVAPFLPEDVIRNILKRLSVKSLIRFQCVCRDWKNLINAPSFIADHLHHSTHHNPCLLFQPKCKGLHPSQLYLLDRQMQVHQLLNPPLFDASRFKIKGSSNGLLCVQLCVEINTQDTCPPPLLLWNPATRGVIKLPMIIDDFFSESDSHLGFGFSPIVNDYKIVRTYAEYEYEIYRVEVFSLSTGSWKVVDFDYMAGTRFLTDAITANGSMFWTGLLMDWRWLGMILM